MHIVAAAISSMSNLSCHCLSLFSCVGGEITPRHILWTVEGKREGEERDANIVGYRLRDMSEASLWPVEKWPCTSLESGSRQHKRDEIIEPEL